MNKFFLGVLLIFSTHLFAQSSNTPITPIDTTNREPIKPPQSKFIDPATGVNTGYAIAENLAEAKTFSNFYKLTEAAGLSETLRSRGPITIFVPDDQAFAKLSKGRMDSLMRPDNLPQLLALVSYHAVPGKLTLRKISSEIDSKTGLATFTTLSGGKLYAKYDNSHNLVLIDETGRQGIITRDGITQHNGLLHIVDTVLQPMNRL